MCRMMYTLAHSVDVKGNCFEWLWWVSRVDWLLHASMNGLVGKKSSQQSMNAAHLSWWSRVCEQMNDLMNNPERPIPGRRQFMGGSSGWKTVWCGVEMHCAKRLIKSTDAWGHQSYYGCHGELLLEQITSSTEIDTICLALETMATQRHQNSSSTLDFDLHFKQRVKNDGIICNYAVRWTFPIRSHSPKSNKCSLVWAAVRSGMMRAHAAPLVFGLLL